MILVTGSAGKLGRQVIDELLKTQAASEIVAAVRSPETAGELRDLGVQVRAADYGRPEQWPAALEGVTRVLLIATSDLDNRVAHHRTVIEAVSQAGSVQLLAYTSMLRAEKSTYLHTASDLEVEAEIRSSGIPHVFLRHPWYIENYTDMAPAAVDFGQLYGAAGDGVIHGASRADLAAAAAHVLTSTDPLEEVYELAGDQGFTLAEVAAEIASASGRDVEYVNLSEDDLAAQLTSWGYPEGIARTLANADTAASRGELTDPDRGLSRLIGRPTTPLDVIVRQALATA